MAERAATVRAPGRRGLEARLLGAALWRRRGTVALAVAALTIGTSVAAALLHVSSDVSRKLSRELRALGPNLLLVPERVATGAATGVAGDDYLDVADARARLRRAGLEGAPLLYLVATVNGRPVQIVGADLEAARRLHPSWSITPAARAAGGAAPAPPSLIGRRLRERLGLSPGATVALVLPGTSRTLEVTVSDVLVAGGPDEESWWIPLADAQALAGLPGRASLVQARVPPGGDPAAVAKSLEAGGGPRALLLHALSDTEAGLLVRMRRLMALVTLAALVAAGLCAFGTLTDLALERRRDIALMKALGAGGWDIVRQLVGESLVIGLLGGVAGWLLGVFFAEIIGRRVFLSPVAIGWDVPPVVIGLSLLVAGLAGLGPIRLALAVEPASALKED
ncbi:MAG TPA: FtsX-like permease family protein [Candidatus Eisenbacteria bacterium]